MEGVARFVDAAHQTLQGGGLLMACGNGGSMCDAMHFAEEWTGRFRSDRRPLPAIAFSDPSHLTCIANDFGYDEVFARQVEACLSHDTHDRLGELAHPTLVVCGRKDLLTPPRFGREIAEAMPNARDIAISYGAHAVMLERADRFNEIVGHFLDDPDA